MTKLMWGQEVDWLMKEVKEFYEHNHAEFRSHIIQT
jgi:hypothetical protein